MFFKYEFYKVSRTDFKDGSFIFIAGWFGCLLKVVEGLKCTTDKAAAIEQIKAMYDVFSKNDCTMAEVNPLAETACGKLIAADAKLNFDDNAAFRQKELFELRDPSQEDPREVDFPSRDFSFIPRFPHST
jgi:succinyl-CoA synthetase beta subunit